MGQTSPASDLATAEARYDRAMEFLDFGWRDGILLAVFLAAIYLVVALLGLMKLRRRSAPHAVQSAASRAEDAWLPEEPREEPRQEARQAELSEEVALTSPKASPPMSPFAAQLALAELEAEVGRLRVEVAALRQELTEVKQTRRVSPLYAEAVALAQRGFDARGVAEECGISVAEAELVLAMSRDDMDFDSEVDDGEADGSGRFAVTERVGDVGRAGAR